MTGDQLTPEQRQRLAVLYAVRDALHVELDSMDLIQAAHWVTTGDLLPIPGTPIQGTIEDFGPDEARWSPKVVQS